MKRLLLLLALLTLTLTACADKPAGADNPMADWEKNAALDAEETPEELYAAALEEDTLVVYSTSTRMMDVAKSFERQYPGLTVRVEDIREDEMYGRLSQQFESGSFGCDIVCSADGRGIMTNEFLPEGVVHKYVPYDIADKILPGNNEALLMLTGEAIVVGYNDAYYEEAPVSNWWELTEPQWRGKIYMPNPTRSMTTSTALGMFMLHSDDMAAAYEAHYGTPLETEKGESAGAYFVQKLIENEVIIVNSSDEAAEAIGAPATVDPSVLGIITSSKLRLRDIGYNIQFSPALAPFCGINTAVNIMIAGGAENVNSAKLFIRWIFGETDGQGEGYRPYLQRGTWSVRSDVQEETGIPLDELNFIYADRAYIYAENDRIQALWSELMAARE